jgi:hypothetical protein
LEERGIEHEQDDGFGLSLVESVLQCIEVGQPGVAEHHGFAVKPGAGQLQGGELAGESGHLGRPVDRTSSEQLDLGTIHPGHQPVAVEVQFVGPVPLVRGRTDEGGELRAQARG